MYYAMMPKHDHANMPSGMRLDKWLWCARFFKTRTLAADAVRNGRILVNSARTKPAKLIAAGTRISISKVPYRFDITVASLSGNRKSAADAASLFTESPESIALREQMEAQLQLDTVLAPGTRGRPTKRERRALTYFKNRL